MTETKPYLMDGAQRIDRVEQDVQTARSEIASLKGDVGLVQADVKALGGILVRIEQGVLRSQEKNEEREQLNKPNLVALVSVLITVISIIVGGSWLISGNLAQLNERDLQQRIYFDTTLAFRNRELDRLSSDLRRLEDRQQKENPNGY